jgi:hypothetical protein
LDLAALEERAGDLLTEQADRMAELTAMTPATVAGCAEVLRDVDAFIADAGVSLFENWRDDLKEPGTTLLSRIADALDQA